MSTGFPIEIKTARPGSDHMSMCRLDIDIYKNVPRILEHEKLANSDGWHGSEISVIIEGCWSTYRVIDQEMLLSREFLRHSPFLRLAENSTILEAIGCYYTLCLFRVSLSSRKVRVSDGDPTFPMSEEQL
jgi:hypothetical protein